MLSIGHGRPARVGAVALALALPLALSTAAPGFASSESTSAVLTASTSGSATTFTWTYTFNKNDGHGLSNLAIGFCSAEILADVVSAGPSAEIFDSGDVPGGHAGFGPGIKFGVTAASGALTVTFASPHVISATGLRIQSHSGDGQDGDSVTVAAGPGPCPADEVTTTTSSSTTTTSTTTTTVPPGGSTTTSSSSTTTSSSTTSSSSTTTTTADLTTQVGGADDVKSTVLGEALEKADETAVSPGSLARTGAGNTMFLLLLALSLITAGIGMRSAFHRRRTGSASSPG